MKLDAYDLKILSIIQRDGRIKNTALAEEIGLSASPSWERLQKLTKAGLIKSFGAEIDIRKIVRSEFFLVEVTLSRHGAADFQKFERYVQKVPEIIACDAVGGSMDYVLRIVASDIGHYQELIDRLLDAEIGIERYFTFAITKSVKSAGELPLHLLLDRQSSQARVKSQ